MEAQFSPEDGTTIGRTTRFLRREDRREATGFVAPTGKVEDCRGLPQSTGARVMAPRDNFRTGRSSPTQLFYDCSKVLNA